MAEFFQQNRDIIFFIYGLAFFVLGLAVALQSRKHSQIPLARHLWLLATFGIVHGIYEWGAVFIPIQQTYSGFTLISLMYVIRLALEVISFLSLFQFGVEVLVLGGLPRSVQLVPILMFTLWGILILIISTFSGRSFLELRDVGDILARYLLGVPSAAAAAWGLWQQARQVQQMEMTRIADYFRGAAFAFGAYALSSAVVPRADFFPASILNYDFLLTTLGIPAAIFRAVCGTIIAILIIRGLEIFDVETERLIEETAQAHAIAADRERIGRELHDSTIQLLYGAGLTLEDAADMIDENPAYAKKRIGEVADTLNRTIRDIRAYILDLRRDTEGTNWRADLGELVRSLRLQTLIDAELVVAGIPAWEPADEESKEILAIARGALTNIARHARATRASVTLTYRAEQIELEMTDNGVGFSPSHNGNSPLSGEHQGLRNMRERAGLIAAELVVESTLQRGTTIRLVLPKRKENKAENYAS
ncbi:MAG: hypothetical protein HZB51_08910 [Chloroflexi bacterium]|nr:hypothetical protein [Chloroflexota bacterium]